MKRKELDEEIDYLKHNIDRIEENIRNIRKVVTRLCKVLEKEEFIGFLTEF